MTSGSDEGESPGKGARLILDWGCSDDSRGHGAKEECGSGLIAVRFDLTGLPDRGTVGKATLTLYTVEAGEAGGAAYARRATSGWTEEDRAGPACDSRDETPAEASEDEWQWDVTEVVRDVLTGTGKSVGFCLILKEDYYAVFVSREGDASRAPALTITID